jgi:hypothetical protein
VSRPPRFFFASKFIDVALSSLGRVSEQLRVDGEDTQHPLYYRANQFWRQLDEFRVELRRCAEANLPPITSSVVSGSLESKGGKS